MSSDVGEGGGDRSSSWKKLRSASGSFALSAGERELGRDLSGILNGALCVVEGKFTRFGLTLEGGDTAVLVCSGLGASLFCDLVPVGEMSNGRGGLESGKFTTALPGMVGLSSIGLDDC